MTTDDARRQQPSAGQSRTGLFLFAVYLAFYSGFVFLNAFAPELMERTAFGGINLAVVYGFGLIVGAVVLSGLYGALCRHDAGPDQEARS